MILFMRFIAKRIEEYQNVLNQLCLQVGSGKITGWEQHLTIRLVCALNLIDDKKEIIKAIDSNMRYGHFRVIIMRER